MNISTEKAHEPDPSEDSAKVFISYSRKDRERAVKISDVLRERKFGVFRDSEDILPTEEWRERLAQLIAQSDTIVFLLSPHSATSEVCAWEVDYAVSLNKRIAPIVIEEVDTENIPPHLSRLNFIFCTERDRFQDAVDSLVSALNVDIDWIREHTRLQALAQRWALANRANHLLLRGQDISDSELWRDSRPPESPAPTAAQLAFVGASRNGATQRQRNWIVGSIALSVAMVGLAVFAYLQMETAVEQKQIAETNRSAAEANATRAESERQRAEGEKERAETERKRAVRARDAALTTQSRFLADLAAQQMTDEVADYATAMVLSLEGLPDTSKDKDGTPLSARPQVAEARQTLSKAFRNNQELRVLSGHSGMIETAVYTKDGKRILSTGTDAEPRIWDVETGTTMALLKDHSWVQLNAPDFSPDEARIVSSELDNYNEDTDVRIWDGQTGELLSKFRAHDQAVNGAVFARNGKAIVTVSRDKTAKIWDTETGKLFTTLSGHPSDAYIGRSSISPDGDRMVTWSGQSAALWNVVTGKFIAELRGHTQTINRVGFDPDGTVIATISWDNTARLWDGVTGALRGEVLSGHSMPVGAMDFSPDGTLLATASDDMSVQLWSVKNGELFRKFDAHKSPVKDVNFSPDGKTLLSSSQDGMVRLFDRDSSKQTHLFGGFMKDVDIVKFDSTGQFFLTGARDATIRIWSNPRAGEGPQRTTDTIASTVSSKDGTRFLTVQNSTIQIWDSKSGKMVAEIRLEDWIQRADFGQDNNHIVLTTSKDDMISLGIWQISDGKMINRFPIADGDIVVPALQVAPDGNRVVTGMHNNGSENGGLITPARIWDLRTGKMVGELAGKVRGTSTVDFSPDGKRLLTNAGATMHLWDWETGEAISTIKPDGDRVRDVAFSPDGKKIISVSSDKIAQIWDGHTGKALTTLTGHGDAPADWPALGDIDYIILREGTFSPDGSTVVTASQDQTARLWDANTGETISVLRGHSGAVTHVAFSPGGRFLVTAGDDGTARIWDPSTGDLLETLPLSEERSLRTPEQSIQFSPDGSRVYISTSEGLFAWSLFTSAQSLVENAKRATPRCLSQQQRERYFLAPEPPRWCITGAGLEAQADSTKWHPKWPYATADWRQWLVERDKGSEPDIPQEDQSPD